MRRRAPRTHLAGLLVALTACERASHRAPPPVGAGVTVVDDAGRSVTLAAPARRVVSLAPSSTELLFAIGAGDRLVGRTTWCRYPAAALAVPVVGDGLNPNLEAVAARRPDLVVLYQSALDETAAAQLSRLGIGAVLIRQDRLEDVARTARLLGRLTGRQRAGDSVAAVMHAVFSIPAPKPQIRLAFVVWDTPPIVIGAGSFLDQLAGFAGAANVFHDLPAASAAVSLETIAARDPDAIAVVTEGDAPGSALPAYAARPEWRAVRAVRERRFLYLPEALFGRPSPRVIEAWAEFRRRLEALR